MPANQKMAATKCAVKPIMEHCGGKISGHSKADRRAVEICIEQQPIQSGEDVSGNTRLMS
jgi:hypothetical protein